MNTGNILYTCTKCKYTTNDHSIILKHLCSKNELDFYVKECEKINNLLNIEKCKILILKELLKKYCNYDVDNIFSEKDFIKFYEEKNSNKIKYKKSSYICDKENVIENITEKEIYINNDDDTENITENEIYINNDDDIQTQYKYIKEHKTYSKNLDTIKKYRLSKFGSITLENYKDLLLNHIKILEEIFNEKKYTDKKIKTIILKSISSLESRLIFYDKYYTTYIEIDEIDKFKNLILKKNNKNTEVFDEHKLYNKFLNYSIVIVPIYQLLNILLINKNIIYLQIPKSTIKNPFSFYFLDKINNNNQKCWRMDCRLEYISFNLRNILLDYMIINFRKIYKNVFGDNIYRENYKDHSQITEMDLEQLLDNIFVLSKPKKFCLYLQNFIITNATYINSDNDKFNLFSDDTLQKKRFLELNDDTDCHNIYTKIFDNITNELAINLYKIKLN
jgi:hypothetical protein